MKPDGIDEQNKEATALGPDGADRGKADKPSLIKNVLLAATGQGTAKLSEDVAEQEAAKAAKAAVEQAAVSAGREVARATKAAKAAERAAQNAVDEASRVASYAAKAAEAAKEAASAAVAANVALVAMQSAGKAAERAAAVAAKEAARRAAEEATAKATAAASEEAKQAAVVLAAREAAAKAAIKAATKAAEDAAKEAAKDAARRAGELAAERAVSREMAEKAAEAAARDAAERAAKEEAERRAQEAAHKAAADAAKEAARLAAQQAAEKAAKEAEAARRAQADRIARATRAARAARAARVARAEKFAKRAAEKAPSQPVVRPKRLNVKLVVALPVTAAVLLIGVFVVHAVQINRTATVMLDKAETALEEGDKDEAIQFFTHYVNYQPKDNEVYSQLALLIAERAKRAANPKALWSAHNILNRASGRDSENWEVRRELAESCIKVGRIEDAANQYKMLVEHFPNDPSLGVKLGRCQVQLQQSREAISTFENVIAQAPHDLEAHVALADLMRDKLGDTDRADAVVNQMVSNNSRLVMAYVERARYWHRGKEIDSASADIRRALEMNPSSADVLVTAAQFAVDDKDFEQAKEYLDKAEALHPDDPSVERARMVLNLTLGHLDDVADHIKGQIERGESSEAGDLFTLADIQLSEGDLKGVESTIKKMRDRGFREEFPQYFEARIRAAEGKWRQASYLLERLRPNVASWPEFLTSVDLLLGACYEQLRLFDRQLNTYQELVNRDPTLDAARAGYASALFRTGKLDDAAAEYAKLKKSMADKAEGETDEEKQREYLKIPAVRNNLFQLIVARTMRLAEGYRDWTELDQFVESLAKVDGVDEVQLTLMRAEVLAKKGEADKARELVDAMLQKHGKDVSLWSASVKLAAMTQGPEQGLRALDAAVKAAGNELAFALARADLAVQLGAEQGKPILATLGAEAEKLPEIEKVRLWRTLGAAYYRLRDRDQARHYWKLVADGPEPDPQMLLVLFELARESGDEQQISEAAKAVRKTLGGRASETHYCEASELIWKAQHDKIDKKALIQAKQKLAQAAAERPRWHEIPRMEAEIALLENKPDEAIKQLQAASEMGPLSPVYLGRLVQLLFARGRYEEARDVINKLGRAQFSLTMKRLQAELNFRLGDFPQALEQAAEAVKQSDRATDFLWYGELLARTRKYREAQDQFRKAVDLDPKIPQGWVGLVALLVEQNKKEEAQRVVREAQASLPEDRTPLVMAQCYHLLGEPGRAEQYYLSALAQHPEDLSVIRHVARFYMLTGRSQEARRYLGQILTLAGRDPQEHKGELVEARRWMARVLAAEGDWRQLQQALALLDRNAKDGQLPSEDLRLKAAMLASRRDQRSQQQAIDLLEEIRDVHKKKLSPQEQFVLAQLYDKTSRWPTARDLMGTLIAENPKEPRYLAAYLGMSLEHDTTTRNAEHLLGNLEKLAPDAPTTKLLKAKLLVKQNKAADAVALLKSLLPSPITRENAMALRQVAAWLEEVGQPQAARELLDQFATKVPGGNLAVAVFLGKHGTTDEALDQVAKALQDKQVPVTAVLPRVINIFTQKRNGGTPITPEQFARVEVWFTQAAEEEPYSKTVQLQTAALRDLQERYADQIKIYRTFLARDDVLDREKAVVWNNLAFLLAAEGNQGQEALKMINQAIDLLGPVPELLDTRAVALIATGDNKGAIQDLRQAIADDPSPIMYFHQAQAYMADGDSRSAAQVLRVAVDNYSLDADSVPKIERGNFEKLQAALKSP